MTRRDRRRAIAAYCARMRLNSSRTDSGRPHICTTSTRPLRTSRTASSPVIPASSSSLSAPCTAGTAAAPAVHGTLRLLDDAGITGELAVRQVRSGRVEIVQMWGRPESARREFRRLRSQ